MTTFEPQRPEDKVVILKRIPVFSSCTEKQLHLIADQTRLVEYKKGECIYREGEAADAFYIVSAGRLRVFSQTNGLERTFTVLHNGDSFGEISLLTGENHSATVQALNDSLVLRLEKKDFDHVINRIPSLVLHLSRLLSRRLRTRERAGEFSEATIVSVYSAVKGVGCTCFAVGLAANLRRETGQAVVIVDLGGSASSRAWLYGATEPLQAPRVVDDTAPLEERVEAGLSTHPLGFGVFFAGDLLFNAAGEQLIAPLLSALINRFTYVLIDLPADVNPSVIKALTQSDVIYVMTDADKEHVARTHALIHQVRSSVGEAEQRIKVVLNHLTAQPSERLGLFTLTPTSHETLSAAEVSQQLGQAVNFVLPYVPSESGRLTMEEFARLLESRGSSYTVTVRYIARELGGLLIGLALGSGAALGLAHIGVLKVIEREHIPVDIIAGSSIGALIAGLWACGRSAEDLERLALQFKNPWDIRKLFVFDLGIPLFSVLVGLAAGVLVGWLAEFWTGLLFGFMVSMAVGMILGPLSGGPIQGARLMAKLEEDFGGKTFEETWLPLKIIASNPMAREEVVFDSGSIAEAVRASVSIPGIFKPVRHLGRVCLDGGVVNPIPVSVLKRSGAHHVIAVNVFPTTPELTMHLEGVARRRAEQEARLSSRSFPVRFFVWLRQELFRSISPLVFDVIMRSMQSMEYQIAEVACREADFTLRPTVPGSHWLEFFHPEKFIRRGEEVALQHVQELRRFTQAKERGVNVV